VAGELVNGKQPLVPEKLVMFGGSDGSGAGAQAGIFQSMMQLLTAWDNMKKTDAEAPPKIAPVEPRQPDR
jgi:hypothetical protein